MIVIICPPALCGLSHVCTRQLEFDGWTQTSAGLQFSVVSCQKQARFASGSPLSASRQHRPLALRSLLSALRFLSPPPHGSPLLPLRPRLSTPNQQPTTITQFSRFSLTPSSQLFRPCQLSNANCHLSLSSRIPPPVSRPRMTRIIANSPVRIRAPCFDRMRNGYSRLIRIVIHSRPFVSFAGNLFIEASYSKLAIVNLPNGHGQNWLVWTYWPSCSLTPPAES